MEEVKKNTHGGRRPGAGRPPKVEGCKTVTVRVPQFLKESIMTYIRLQADAIADGKGRTVAPLTAEEERTRKELIRDMEALAVYERKRRSKKNQKPDWIDKHTRSLFD